MRIRAVASAIARRWGLGSYVDALSEARVPYIVRRDREDARRIRALLRFALPANANCVDIGANEGAVLQMMCDAAPAGHHIAFEPLPELAANLRAKFDAAEIQQLAVSNRTGSADFIRVIDHPAMSGFRPQDYPDTSWRSQHIRVDTAPLDSLLPFDYSPTLIKIDVEGAEREVLEGASQTLRSCPLLVFEHGKIGAGFQGYGPEALWPLLDGYRVFDIDGGGPYTLDAWRAVFDEGRLWTWVARRQ